MLRALRARPWLIAAAAAAIVGVPVAAMVLLAGGGGPDSGGASATAARQGVEPASDVDKLIAQRAAGGAQAAEPSVGAPSQVVVQTETGTDFPAPSGQASAKGADGVSPGAPSDA